MVTAHGIVENLGPGVVTALVIGQPSEVTGLRIHADPGQDVTAGAWVIAPAARDEQTQLDVVGHAAGHRAAGVVLRGPVGGRVTAATTEADLTLAALADDMAWVEFISMADAVLRQVTTAADPADDAYVQVFRLADDIADLLQAPVTVEDVRSQVLAYAAFGEIGDEARTGSIVGRVVPPKIVAQLRAAGTFRRMAVSHAPFVVEVEDPGFLTRLVVPLRVGPELVGSIWAIRAGELTSEEHQRLRAPARSLGLLLVRLRAHDELASRYGPDRVREAFRHPVDTAHDALTLPAPRVRVMAMDRLEGTSARDDLVLWRTIFRRHGWADPILADMDGVVFAILTDDDAPGSWAWARAMAAGGYIGPVGASRPTRSASDLPARNREALEVLRTAVLHGHAAADYEDAWAQIVIRRTHATVPDDAAPGLEAVTSGRGDHVVLATTLLTWLMCWGDHNRAGRLLRLHPNTVRQRLRRIKRLAPDVDLSDPEQRLALVLVLHARLRHDTPGPASPGRPASP